MIKCEHPADGDLMIARVVDRFDLAVNVRDGLIQARAAKGTRPPAHTVELRAAALRELSAEVMLMLGKDIDAEVP